MLSEESLTILAKTDVFKGFHYDELKLLSKHAHEVTVEKGEAVINEGQPGNALYVVLAGKLQVTLLKGKRGRPTDVALNTLRKHDCFGEYSLIDNQPTSASVIAQEKSLLCQLTRPNLNYMLSDRDKLASLIYQNLIQILIKRLRKKDRELDLTLDYD